MAEHTVQVKYAEQKRYTNDIPVHTDNEYYMLRLLQDHWDSDSTQAVSPFFYLTDKQITNDLSVGPAIIVHETEEDSDAVGIGYVAERLKMTMIVSIITLDRSMLFDVKDEVKRILLFCRLRPIPNWDFIYSISEKRNEARAGNYRFDFVISIYRLVKPIPDSDWRAPLPLYVSISSSALSGVAPLTLQFYSLAHGGKLPYVYQWDFGNGDTDTFSNPIYTYNSMGTYEAQLILTDANGVIVYSNIISIEVTEDYPQVFFTNPVGDGDTYIYGNPVYYQQQIPSDVTFIPINRSQIDVLSDTTFVTTPSVPQSVSAIKIDDFQSQLTWNAPLTDGGSPITSYNIYKYEYNEQNIGSYVLLTATTDTDYYDDKVSVFVSSTTEVEYFADAIILGTQLYTNVLRTYGQIGNSIDILAKSSLSYLSDIFLSTGTSGSASSYRGICSDGIYMYLNRTVSGTAPEESTGIVKRRLSDWTEMGLFTTGTLIDPIYNCVSGSYVYFTDYGAHALYKIDKSSMAYVNSIGGLGSGNDQFDHPVGICTDDTYLYICDIGNNRIVKRLCSDLSYVEQLDVNTATSAIAVPMYISTDGTYLYMFGGASWNDWSVNAVVKLLKSDWSYIGMYVVPDFYAVCPVQTESSYMWVGTGSQMTRIRNTFTGTWSQGEGPDVYYKVSAVNASGEGTISDPAYVSMNTPLNLPSAPLNVQATFTGTSAIITWEPPAVGEDIMNYSIFVDEYFPIYWPLVEKVGNVLTFTDTEVTSVKVTTGTTLSGYVAGNTVDSNYLYVCDRDYSQVLKFNRDAMTYVTGTGSQGSGTNQLYYPFGITNDGTYLYICDSWNSRVVKRNCSDLAYVTSTGSNGSGNDQFAQGFCGICTDNTYIYVADGTNDRIVKRNCSNLAYVSKIGSHGTGNDNFNEPNGICTDGTYLYVADTLNDRIVKRQCSNLSYVTATYADYGTGFYLDMIYGICTDGTYVYALDRDAYKIYKMRCSDLALVETLYGGGYERGYWLTGQGLSTDGSYLYITNSTSGSRVTRRSVHLTYNPTGRTADLYYKVSATNIVGEGPKSVDNDPLQFHLDVSSP